MANNVRAFPLRFSGIRGDDQRSWDFSILKNFPVGERVKVGFRAEVYNAWNEINFSGPSTNPTASDFGAITATSGDSRNWQLSLRIQF